jgi:hypothetical protein
MINHCKQLINKLSSTRSVKTYIASNHRGGYYALIKRGGKQFRRSLKAKNRKLAQRRAKVGALTISEDSNSTFEQAATRGGISPRAPSASASGCSVKRVGSNLTHV